MSLINEALKRTRDSAYQSAQTLPPVVAEYRLESEVKARGPKRVLVVMGVIGAAVLAGIIVLAMWVVPRIQSVEESLNPGKTLSIAEPKSSTPATRPTPTAVVSPKTEVALPPTPQPPVTAPPADTKGAEDQIVAKVMERIKAEQPAAPATPQLVLQGITYASDNRDAMINGVTVHEGEEIEGARVVTIDNRRVTLDLNGHEIILRLP
ncbi:MAG: general secretion pathway protein GspB [Verrucomicrobiia bacterium]